MQEDDAQKFTDARSFYVPKHKDQGVENDTKSQEDSSSRIKSVKSQAASL